MKVLLFLGFDFLIFFFMGVIFLGGYVVYIGRGLLLVVDFEGLGVGFGN